MTRVVVTFALDEDLVAEIAAVDPSLDVAVLGQAARAIFRWDSRYPSELQAHTGMEELEAALSDADVLFSFWGGGIAEMPQFREKAPKLRWVQLTHAGAERVNASRSRRRAVSPPRPSPST
jgi:hypothetical protein